MTLGLQHYSEAAVGIDRVLGYSYWKQHGIGIVIVAQEGFADDWAAYIGALGGERTERESVAYACRYGAKLTRGEAQRWFPELPTEAYRP